MGTNFYYIKSAIENTDMGPFVNLYLHQSHFKPESDEIDLIHIGKRSFAGKFCKNCNIQGFETKAKQCSSINNDTVIFYDKCPICGQPIKDTTCRFTWRDYNRDRYLLGKLKNNPDLLIVDEYGTKYSVDSFLKIVNDCGIYSFLDIDFC